MRRVHVQHVAWFALVFTAGCSLVFDMDPYDPRAAGRATPDGGGGEASSSGASSGGSSSGTISPQGDSGVDGSDATIPCKSESEPNDTQSQASAIAPGKNCGAVSTAGDIDNWSVTGPAKLVIVIPSGIQFNVIVDGAGSILRQQAGSHDITLGTGNHRVTFQTFDGTTADYDITR